MTDEVAVGGDLVAEAKENLGAETRVEAVEMALFLACAIENPDEILGVHGYREQVERGRG